MFLQEFGDHANIIKLHNVLKAENDKDIYLVFEFMGKNYWLLCFIQPGEINGLNRSRLIQIGHLFN